MDEEQRYYELKQAINELLWRKLPPSITLEDAELIAVSFYDAIMGAWRAHDLEESRRGASPSQGGE